MKVFFSHIIKTKHQTDQDWLKVKKLMIRSKKII